MLNLNKKETFKNYFFFKSNLININLFFVDLEINIPNSISSFLYKDILFLKKETNNCFFKNKKLFIFKKNKRIFIIINEKDKQKFKKLN